MDRDTSVGYLLPLSKSSASLGMVEWEARDDQWCGMVHCKSQKYCTVSGRVPKVSWLTAFRKEGWIKKLDAWATIKYKGVL